MSKYCPNCKKEFESGKFCVECSAKLIDIVYRNYCPACNKVVESGKFCVDCGSPLISRKYVDDDPLDDLIGIKVDTPHNGPTDEAILAKYSDEFDDMRELNEEEAPVAVEEIKKIAEKGNPKAETFLAYLYFDGKYIEQDYQKSYDLLCDAESKGYVLASAYKAMFYVNGIIVNQDLNEAERLIEPALDIPPAMYLKGMICLSRDEEDEAVRWFKKAADNGDDNGLTYLGIALLQGTGGVPLDPVKAFECFNKSAALGNAEAENMLGVCYQKGQGTEPDEEQALYWYQEAVKHNDPNAQNNLANCYKNGLLGLETDPEKAFELYKKAAEQDHVDAMFEVAEYYDASYLTAQKSVEWYQKAADAGHGDAMFELAQKYEKGWNVDKDPAKAQEYYAKAAEAGCERAIHREEDNPSYMNWLDETGQRLKKELTDDVYDVIINEIREDAENGVSLAQKLLGDFYFDGDVMAQNYTEAIKWYRKAAEQDVYGAQNNLGVCYYNGFGVAIDYSEAVKWYKKSAKHGNAVAQFNLGNCYASGNGVEQNSIEAIKWYKKAANQGHLLAQDELNKIDKKKANSTPATPEIEKAKAALKKNDLKVAISVLKKLSNQADPEAQLELAKCYQEGIGVTKNTSVAASWLNKAADLGYVPAYYALGQRNEFGTDITPNQEQAAKWYRKAAEQGHLESQFRLGLMYDDGRGVKQNDKKASELIKKAADNGLKEAKDYLASLKDKPTATIKKTWIETDINYSPTRRGLRFHIDFEVHNIMNKEFNCSINFFYDWGNKVSVYNTDPQELSVDGALVVGESQIAQFNDVICNDWKFEVPYYLLCNHDNKGNWPIIARIIIFDMSGKKATELRTFEKKFSIIYSKKLFGDPTYEVVVK